MPERWRAPILDKLSKNGGNDLHQHLEELKDSFSKHAHQLRFQQHPTKHKQSLHSFVSEDN